jgi:hypothetical protein
MGEIQAKIGVSFRLTAQPIDILNFFQARTRCVKQATLAEVYWRND